MVFCLFVVVVFVCCCCFGGWVGVWGLDGFAQRLRAIDRIMNTGPQFGRLVLLI